MKQRWNALFYRQIFAAAAQSNLRLRGRFRAFSTCRFCYHNSDFTSGFTSTVTVNGPVRGPLGKAGVIGKGLTPRSLKRFLDTYVISQTKAKRVLSSAVYQHYLRAQSIRRQEDENAESMRRGAKNPSAHPVEDEYPGQQTFPASQTKSQVDAGDETEPSVELQKSNCLILGPSGTGKTLIAKTLAKVLDVPFSISDCTAFTQAGYVGEDVDVCVQRLLASCNWDVKRAETGIICLDEVDKIASVKSSSHMRDVSGEGVQQALLKILEGTTLEITSPRSRPNSPQVPSGNSFSNNNPASPIHNFGSFGSGSPSGSTFSTKGETYSIDTSNILFILCGAFNGLSKIITDRISKHSIGFNAPVRARQSEIHGVSSETEKELQKLYGLGFPSSQNTFHIPESEKDRGHVFQQRRRKINMLDFTEPRDLISFGFIPEFIGRIPVVAALDTFDEETLVRVLSEPRNSLLKQYIRLFHMSGVELRFTSRALTDIAKASLAMDTGARALRTLLERLLSDAMFEAPGSSIKHILVNSDAARFKQPPVYFARGQQDQFHTLYTAEEAEWDTSRVSGEERWPDEEISIRQNMAVSAS